MIRMLPVPVFMSVLMSGGNLARAQSEPAFSSLFSPALGLDNWQLENGDAASFHYEDGMLEVRGSEGWLRSTREYGDFVLRLQFRNMEIHEF